MHLFKVFINSFLNTFLFLFCKIIPTRKNHHSIIRATYTYDSNGFVRFFRIGFSLLHFIFNINEKNFWKIIRKNLLLQLIRLRIQDFILPVPVEFFPLWIHSVLVNWFSIPVVNILDFKISLVFLIGNPDILFIIRDFNDLDMGLSIRTPVRHLEVVSVL